MTNQWPVIIKIRRHIYDASVVAFTIMKVLQRHNYDAGVVAQCFELTNSDHNYDTKYTPLVVVKKLRR